MLSHENKHVVYTGRTCLSQAALAVAVTPHLAIWHRIDPAFKSVLF